MSLSSATLFQSPLTLPLLSVKDSQQKRKDLCLSAQPLPSPFPQWGLEEQRPLGLVGQRGGEMLEANGEEGSAVTQMSLWQ